MKAKRIIPKNDIDGLAVWANLHGEWRYDSINQVVRVQVALFGEQHQTVHIYPVISLPATNSDWQDDEQVINAAFAHHGIQIDTEWVEPIVEEQPQQESEIVTGDE